MKQITAWLMSFSLLVMSNIVVADEAATENFGVSIDYDIKNVDGAPYGRYIWLANSTIINDPTGEWEPADYDIDAYFTELVEHEFAKKGYSKADQEGLKPELGLMYFAGVNVKDADLDDSLKQSVSDHVVKGALVFVVTDLELGKPVMVVSASAITNSMKSEVETAKARINYVAKSVLTKFPKSGERFLQ